MRACFLLTQLVLLVFAQRAFGQAGPPLISDDPGTPGDGNWEINFAVGFELSNRESQIVAPLADFNYGAGDFVQLKVEGEGVVCGSRSCSMSDSEFKFGVKWRFFEDLVSFSIYPQISSSYGDVQKWNLFLPAEFSSELTVGLKKFEVSGEVGWQLNADSQDALVAACVIGARFSSLELLLELVFKTTSDLQNKLVIGNFGGRLGVGHSTKLMWALGLESKTNTVLGYLGVQLEL